MNHLPHFDFSLKIRGDIRRSRCTTGVSDTGGKVANSVNYTSDKFATGINDFGNKQWEQYQTADTLK
jgi:hypothetical protein